MHGNWLRLAGPSGLFHEFGLEHESALLSLAIHLMVASAVWQANAFDFGAFFQHDGRAKIVGVEVLRKTRL